MSPPVIITGMHRSGTSLLASLLHRAGLHLGERLLGPGPGNRRGYFEDLDFVEFHDELFAALGTTLYLDSPMRGQPSGRDRARAAALIEARSPQPAWGWKDPRTALFLDFWLDQVPAARFVFVYREPAAVVDSLRRRRDPPMYLQFRGAVALERLGFPRFRAGRALRVWHVYNAQILSFVERNRDRCTLVRAETLGETIGLVIEHLAEHGVPLCRGADVASIIDPGFASTGVPRSIQRACHRDGRANEILRALDAAALSR
jgi:hypothetical protein